MPDYTSFAQRRKTLRAALARWAGSAEAAEQACRRAGIDPGARGERLGVADFVALTRALTRDRADGTTRPGDDRP